MHSSERHEIGSRAGKLRPALAILLVLLVASSGLTPVATAYPRSTNAGCNVNYVNMNFNNSAGTWPSARETEVVQGAAKWNNIRTPTGSTFLGSGIGNTHQVYWLELGPGTRGRTVCGGIAFPDDGYMEFDNDLSGNELRGVAAHEVGHMHGYNHSGEHDSEDVNDPPIMSTCLSDAQRATTGSTPKDRDDFGQAIAEHLFGVSANQSFENNKNSWYYSGGGSNYSIQNSGGSDGAKFARFVNPPSGKQLRSWVRNEDPTTYDARVNVRTPNSFSGYVSFRLQVRRINYGSSPDCAWPNGHNFNWRSFVAPYNDWTTVQSLGRAVGSSWDWSTLNDWSGATNWEAVDLRVVVEFNGTGTVDIDNTRVRTQ